jgi:outer membrane protein TolC
MPAPATAKETSIEALPLEERIRRRAYELYVERGNQSGSELDDWLQAEEEVLRSQEQALAVNWSRQR